MFVIPKEYKEKIYKMYPKEAKIWEENINKNFLLYIEKFGLEQIKPIKNLTMNLVCMGVSKYFDDEVVIKIGKPLFNIEAESQMLKLYGENKACKCYFASNENAVMILEKLQPGYNLSTIKDQKEKIHLYAKVQNEIMIEAIDNYSFKRYKEDIEKKFSLTMKEKEKYKEIIQYIPLARKYYQEILQEDPKEYILHGDLNEGNILKSKDTWKVIDPQGIIGPKVVEAMHFTISQITKEKLQENEIEEIISQIANEIEVSKNSLIKAVFVELIHRSCWQTRLNYPEENIYENIEIAEIMKKMLSY